MIITCSAPGKLILFGEHASSRNNPAIVFAVNYRLTASLVPITKTGKPLIHLSSEEYNVQHEPYPSEKLDLVSKAIELFHKKTEKTMQSFDLKFASNIPAGFGSSAAAIVATLGILDSYYETQLSKFELLKLGLETNYAIKGYGSGLDIGAALYGGLIKYQKGLEPVNLPHEQLNPIIGSTGVKAPSGPIVESVKQLEKKTPHMTTTIFASIEQIVEEAIVAIKKGNITKIGYLMNQNQALLKQLGVSSNILDEMINAALNAGALGAKLSGAGIGDNMIALSDENKQEAIITALNKTAGQALPECKIDPQGIILSKEL